MAAAAAAATPAAVASAGSTLQRCPRQQPGPRLRCSLTSHAPVTAEVYASTARPAQGRPAVAAAAFRAAERGAGRRQQLFVQVEPDGSDSWRLDPVVEALNQGAVGIIPTGEGGARAGEGGSVPTPGCMHSRGGGGGAVHPWPVCPRCVLLPQSV